MKLNKYIGNKQFYYKVFVIAIPLLIQQLITSFVNMLDNIMVGQTGTLAMSGVSVSNQIVTVFNLAVFGSISAASIFGAQFAGKKDTDGVRNCLRFKLIVEILIACIFIFGFLVFGKNLIGLFMHPEQDDLTTITKTMEYATQYIMGSEVRTYPKLLTSASFHLGPVTITMQQVYIFVITVILMVVLQFIVQKTKMGRAMRAVSVDEDAARLMGIDVDKTISFTFLLGSALAGVAGVLVGIYYNSINPLMGMTPGLKAFIAAVFGGIGSIPGAMIGGLFIGIAETMVTAYGSSLYKDAIVYIILILILILKPAGLLGKNVREKV